MLKQFLFCLQLSLFLTLYTGLFKKLEIKKLINDNKFSRQYNAQTVG